MNNLFKRISILTFVLVIAASLSTSAFSNNKISEKVFINDLNVSGKTKTQALELLKHKYDAILKTTNISLIYNGQVFKLDPSTIKLHYDYNSAINKALSIVRVVPAKPVTPAPVVTDAAITTDTAVTTDSAATVIVKTPTPKLSKIIVKLAFTYDKKSLNDYLKKLSDKLYLKPINSVMTENAKNFYFSDSKDGVELNITKANTLISKNLIPGKISKLALPMDVVKAKYTKDNLLDVKDKLGEYTTSFRLSDINRVDNIKLAASNANNFIVMPGEIFSINNEIGPRIEKYGFKLAHVIVNNRFVDGIGGGICQVSTTLYNAALKANLKIVERTHHSIPSTYVPVGRDATVSGNVKDLKFQNNTTAPLYVTNTFKDNTLTYKIYGKNDFPYRSVRIKTQTLEYTPSKTVTVMDSTLERGKSIMDVSPHPGYKVRSYREIYEKGKLVKTEELYIDKYPLITGIKKVGTK